MTLLEVFIPTYNRPVELEKCLKSLNNALLRLMPPQRRLIGVTINDNSTSFFHENHLVISKYSPMLSSLGLSYFHYRCTGFNIGSINNIVGGILSAESDYIWCLPDDDLARFDSLQSLVPILQQFAPSFISGAWIVKTVIPYSSDEIGIDDSVRNSVYDIIYDDSKIFCFLSNNVVQLQEYVYKVAPLKLFLRQHDSLALVDDMCPGLFALVCLQENAPFVRLSLSIGIFRDGDPRSEWRHLWMKLSLIDWPILSERLFTRGLLSIEECYKSISVFRSNLFSLSSRPDILLGLNPRAKINPFLLFRYHRYAYCRALLLAPYFISKCIFRKLHKLLLTSRCASQG